jgi:hypothetical protein
MGTIMCHGFECFTVAEMIDGLIWGWTDDLDPRKVPSLAYSLNIFGGLKARGLAEIVTPQGLARFIVMDAKEERLFGKLADLMVNVQTHPVARDLMNAAMFAEGLVTSADLGFAPGLFPPTAPPMAIVKADAEMVALERQAETDARAVQAEVALAEKKRRALRVALDRVKV